MPSTDIFESLERHLKTTDEVELLLLRGHLIIEHCLNAMLLLHISSEDELQRLSLTFARKTDLLVALRGRGTAPAKWIAHLREINRIRNKLAHQLDFASYHSDLKRWACAVTGYEPKSLNRRATYRNTVMRAFYMLSGFLSGWAEGARSASDVRT